MGIFWSIGFSEKALSALPIRPSIPRFPEANGPVPSARILPWAVPAGRRYGLRVRPAPVP
ncbi:hypothetical protein D9M69_696820 [compost metagenome]